MWFYNMLQRVHEAMTHYDARPALVIPQDLLRSAAVSRTLYLSLALLRLAATCRCPEKQRNHRRKYAVKVARVRARKVSLARCVLAVTCNGPGYQGKHRRNGSVKVAKLRA